MEEAPASDGINREETFTEPFVVALLLLFQWDRPAVTTYEALQYGSSRERVESSLVVGVGAWDDALWRKSLASRRSASGVVLVAVAEAAVVDAFAIAFSLSFSLLFFLLSPWDGTGWRSTLRLFHVCSPFVFRYSDIVVVVPT